MAGRVPVVSKLGPVAELCGIGGGVMGELGHVAPVVRVGPITCMWTEKTENCK